jgi:phosphatidate phosphatase APP1
MIVPFPTYARRIPGSPHWRATVAGMVIDPLPAKSGRRVLAMAVLRRLFDLDEAQLGQEIFRRRAEAFLFRRVAGARVSVRIGERLVDAGSTDKVGHYQMEIDLDEAGGEALAGQRGQAILYGASATDPSGVDAPAETGGRSSGRIHLIGDEGLSVISDIDDTVKVTNVANRRELLANTLFREFRAVPGMPDVYRDWQATGAAFHYVSASPWQLASCLDRFFTESGIPGGSMHLKLFRLKDSTPLGRLPSRKRSKRRIIEQIMADFPRRRFLLVGDSGERDADVYTAIARRRPSQVSGVVIRRVAGHAPPATIERRLDRLARRLPRGMFRVFDEPDTIRPLGGGAVPSAQG